MDAGLPQLAAHLKPSIFGSITSSRIRSHASARAAAQRILAIADGLDVVAMTAQIFLESERDIRFVFDNQDAGS